MTTILASQWESLLPVLEQIVATESHHSVNVILYGAALSAPDQALADWSPDGLSSVTFYCPPTGSTSRPDFAVTASYPELVALTVSADRVISVTA
ncbi:hypothetical protein TPY_1255 [Sulfobacillus acidophilus TPY]|uniref:Uncharacterized protein n=1 Tax=Sulfobacillus acidophilus (strain ATCC 700253 / DSM 10332 / NAL) TaxID=679936 RepID=G8TVE1_SULAD|nr:hypothetical protein TPY_1255 [Sulfobacillus acidophilus TPY]AEW05860.1 hypothetical protein Sulac_2397 [Sulfobacillus acidophilus DSM 10332]